MITFDHIHEFITTQLCLIIAQNTSVTMSDLANVCEIYDSNLHSQQVQKDMQDAMYMAPAYNTRSKSSQQKITISEHRSARMCVTCMHGYSSISPYGQAVREGRWSLLPHASRL